MRAWDAELPARDGVDVVTELLNRVTPRFPALRSGSRSGSSASPSGGRRTGVSSSLWIVAALVLLIHAASQGVTPEFALPLYPVFIVTALGALAGEKTANNRMGSGSVV